MAKEEPKPEPEPQPQPQPQPQPHNRKRTRPAPSTGTLQPLDKRPKSSRRSRTPPEFWDNLSQVPLCPRALREFNRRTLWPVVPEPPVRFVLKGDLVEQLKHFARHGGPSLRDIRGLGNLYDREGACMISSQQPHSSHSQGKGKMIRYSSTDPAFEQALRDIGIDPFNLDVEPNKFDEIKERLARPRPSLSGPSYSDASFKAFLLKNREATSEAKLKSKVIPILEGNTAIPSGEDLLFNNVDKLAKNIKMAKPDYYDGSDPTELNVHVRTDLSKRIMPCTNTSLPLLPNHFTEVRLRKTGEELRLQITQDLVIGARGMLAIQSYGQDGYTYDGNAYTLGSTYVDGVLKVYVMHATQPVDPSQQPEYRTTQIGGVCMTNSADDFRRGMMWYRNGRELAKEWRDSAIAQANATAAAQASVTVNAEQSQRSTGSRGDTNEMMQDDTGTSLSKLDFYRN